MGWYDEAFRESGGGRWRREPVRGWWVRRGGLDWSETQGGDYGAEYRGRGYPYGTGYRPGSEGGFASRAPWTRQFDEDDTRRFAYDGEYAGEAPRPRRARGLSDDEVLESVRENLFQDSYIDPESIQVRVEDGVVTLSGFVRDYLEARYAWDDSWESPGVRGVINRLEVREGE